MNNKKMILNACVYVSNNIIIKAFQFFLVPVYTAYLTSEEYGANNMIVSFVSILTILATLSISSATSRLYAEHRDDKERVGRLFGSIYLFTVLFGAAVVAALFAGRQLMSAFLLPDIDFFPVVALALINMWLTALVTQYTSMLQAMQESKECALLNVIYFTMSLSLNILFVAVLDMKLSGIYYSSILVSLCLILFSLWRMHKRKLMRWVLDRNMLSDALKYSIPLIPHSLSGSISQFLAKLMLGNSFSLAAVGIFSLAGQFGRIIDTVQSSVHSAYLPWFFEVRGNQENDAPQAVKSLLPILLDLYSIFFLAFALFSQELLLIMADNSFSSAWIMIPLFVCIYAIKTPYYFYSAFLFYDKVKTRFIFVATIIGNLVNVLASALLIPHWGAYGSLAADLTSTVILLCIIVGMCRGENVPYFRFSLFMQSNLKLFLFIAGGLLPGLLLLGSQVHILNIIFKLTIFALFLLLIFKRNRASIYDFVKRFKSKKGAAT